MIYRLALGGKSNRVKVFDVKKKQFETNNLIQCPNLSVLRVNKQVCLETTLIFQEIKTCCLDFGISDTALRNAVEKSLRSFRKFEVCIPTELLDLGLPSWDPLYELFTRIRDEIDNGNVNAARSTINVKFHEKFAMNISAAQPVVVIGPTVIESRVAALGENYRYACLWLQFQLGFHLDQCRKRFYAIPETIITSETDRLEDGMLVQRMDERVVCFADSSRQRLGCVFYHKETVSMTVVYDADEDPEAYIASAKERAEKRAMMRLPHDKEG